MKNKFLAFAAVGAAALGGAILSSPANAQIPSGSGPSSTFDVNVTVPEILYLRTVDTVDVAITPTQLVGAAGAAALQQVGTTNAYINAAEDQTELSAGVIDTTSPFTVGANATVNIPGAYIVWSNSPTGNYTVDITPSTFTNSVSTTSFTPTITAGAGVQTALGLTHTTTTAVSFDVPLTSTTAGGTYAGTLTVSAYRP